MEYRQNKLGSLLTTMGLLMVVAFGTVRGYKRCQRECEQITRNFEVSDINVKDIDKGGLNDIIKFGNR